ncbi:type II toxin-antitoxin system HicA family toxin [Methylovirgula sp. 4M-Z18]|uniref:type II toxin-antitoxin system HicA family toxin n=1 Tax=Methylovirgula sp. 4M-Z18 TaxID=2293567 RepID=UPI000E2EE727|nr:type II toxin-antitoxin system HicA family toxin [Methylovirgula sp. 4M-Z18]RFB80418.1 addiction module toxin, HicA family [Methylovirgula sp. 4M-Z18]
MSPKRNVESPKDIIKRLLADCWTERLGKGDHRNFKKPGMPLVTIDTGVKEIPIGTLRNIYRCAGWQW